MHGQQKSKKKKRIYLSDYFLNIVTHFEEPTRVPHLKIILLFLFAQHEEVINSILNTFGTHIDLNYRETHIRSIYNF